MSKVIANMSMSLDGFIADPADQIDQLFGWMGSGEVEVPTAADWSFRVSATSADYLRNAMARVGALISGRHLFDITHGWGGIHPVGVPVVVVTHETPADWPHAETFTFVDSVQKAVEVARDLAGAKDVVVASSKIAQQCLDAGLLDEIHVDLVPVLLGEGVPWFENLAKAPVRLGTPTVTEGDGVTHLVYSVTSRSSGEKNSAKRREGSTMNWTLEVVAVPVSDVDRAKAFYADQLGFAVDHDTAINDQVRFVQLTPPGSGCSIVVGKGAVPDMAPGSLKGLQLIVPNIHKARAQLIERGVEVSEIQVMGDNPHPVDDPLDNVGFVYFSDPDGNGWAVQQMSSRG